MTETLTKIIVDCSTGEQTTVPLTAEEIEQMEAQRIEQEAAEAERLAAEAQTAQDKADAIAALVALGLTEAQIAALSK